MIPIYITAFNRPFYLDRCIWSIKKYVTGYSRIKVLDGGTPDKYQEKLNKLHPEVEVIVSADDAFDFWMREIEKESYPYFCMLHDDTWFTETVDLGLIEIKMEKYNLPVVKLIYGTEFMKGIDTVVIDYVEVFKPNFNYHEWQSWMMLMIVFLKEYWLVGFRANEHKLGRGWCEEAMLKAANDYIITNNLNAGRMPIRSMRQGQAMGSRTDLLSRYNWIDQGLAQPLFLNAVNECWYKDEFNIFENFPKDFSTKYLETIFTEYNVPNYHIATWKKVRSSLRDEIDFLI